MFTFSQAKVSHLTIHLHFNTQKFCEKENVGLPPIYFYFQGTKVKSFRIIFRSCSIVYIGKKQCFIKFQSNYLFNYCNLIMVELRLAVIIAFFQFRQTIYSSKNIPLCV